jgi:3-oxoacyl-(acyl-carrier-protein) synthase
VDCATVIAGTGAITALGRGIAPLLVALRANASGLRAQPGLEGRGYGSTVVGRIPESVESAVAAGCGAPEDARAFRLAHEAMLQAVAGTVWHDCPPARRSLVLATTKGDLPAFERLQRGDSCSPAARRHAQPALLAADLGVALEVQGPIRCVSVACVSGLLALQLGARLIQRDAAEVALVVGVDLLSHFVLAGFTSLKSLDPEGCRPFDQNRVGLTIGEAGAAILMTRPPPDCGPGWRLTGWGSSNDANHLTGPSRDGSGLALAMQRTLTAAALDPDEITYLHAHGTGTPYNDAMEAHAIRRVFADALPRFSSSKGLFGHTLGAAGVLETLLCLNALDDGWLPGTPRLADPDPLTPPTVLREPLPVAAPHSFMKVNCGFGGANAAVVLRKEN